MNNNRFGTSNLTTHDLATEQTLKQVCQKLDGTGSSAGVIISPNQDPITVDTRDRDTILSHMFNSAISVDSKWNTVSAGAFAENQGWVNGSGQTWTNAVDVDYQAGKVYFEYNIRFSANSQIANFRTEVGAHYVFIGLFNNGSGVLQLEFSLIGNGANNLNVDFSAMNQGLDTSWFNKLSFNTYRWVCDARGQTTFYLFKPDEGRYLKAHVFDHSLLTNETFPFLNNRVDMYMNGVVVMNWFRVSQDRLSKSYNTGLADNNTQRVVLASNQPSLSLLTDSTETDSILQYNFNNNITAGGFWDQVGAGGSWTNNEGYKVGSGNTRSAMQSFKLEDGILYCECQIRGYSGTDIVLVEFIVSDNNVGGDDGWCLGIAIDQDLTYGLNWALQTDGTNSYSISVNAEDGNGDTNLSWLNTQTYNTYKIEFDIRGTIKCYIWKPDEARYILNHTANFGNLNTFQHTWTNQCYFRMVPTAVNELWINWFRMYQVRKSRDYNTGNVSNNTQRVVLATNQPSVDVSMQIAGTDVSTGAGSSDAQTQRVIISTDSAVQSVQPDYEHIVFTDTYEQWKSHLYYINVDTAPNVGKSVSGRTLKLYSKATFGGSNILGKIPWKFLPDNLFRYEFSAKFSTLGTGGSAEFGFKDLSATQGITISKAEGVSSNQLTVSLLSAGNQTVVASASFDNTFPNLEGSLNEYRIDFTTYENPEVKFYVKNNQTNDWFLFHTIYDSAQHPVSRWTTSLFYYFATVTGPSVGADTELEISNVSLRSVRFITIPSDKKLITHKYLTESNDGTTYDIGVQNLTVNDEFYYSPAANEIFLAYRFIIRIEDTGSDPDKFGNQTALANGFEFYYSRDANDETRYLGHTDLRPVKTNGDIDSLCYDSTIHLKGGGTDDVLIWRFSLDKSGLPVTLYPGGEIGILWNDALNWTAAGPKSFTIQVQGHTQYL